MCFYMIVRKFPTGHNWSHLVTTWYVNYSHLLTSYPSNPSYSSYPVTPVTPVTQVIPITTITGVTGVTRVTGTEFFINSSRSFLGPDLVLHVIRTNLLLVFILNIIWS